MPAHARIRVAACAVENGRILLVEHRKEGTAYHLLPGGGVEPGESLHAALRREVREECGLDARPGDLVLVCETIAPRGDHHVVHMVFRAHVDAGPVVAGLDGTLSGAAWHALSELPGLDLRPRCAAELAAVIAGTADIPLFLGDIWRPAP